ncbi:DUF2619 domain-containing protein [Metasolibacillus fluoroglycofenilyticus]|uniref:DUF2619 domain-containing protein n=2 Tax=Caryophanaceae TaxID=186818 RepID=UPI000B05D835
MELALLYMIWLRILSGSVDIFAALIMYKLDNLEKAFIVNTSLALVGPIIFIITTGIGLAGMQDKISLPKMLCLFSGIFLIFISLRMK